MLRRRSGNHDCNYARNAHKRSMIAIDSSQLVATDEPALTTDADYVHRCEALIDEARRGNVGHVETTARRWHAEAMLADHARSTGLAAHAVGTCLLIQSRNAESIAILVDAAQSARDHDGDQDRYVRALVQSASALTYMGAHHRALELLADASRLSDQPISERTRYVMHSVRATLETQVRNFDEALLHQAAARHYADLEPSGLSSLINRAHTGELCCVIAVDRIRRNEAGGDALLRSAAVELLLTADKAANANVPRVMLASRAAAAFAVLWHGDFHDARRIIARDVDGDAISGATVDVRLRFACVTAVFALAEGASGCFAVEHLLAQYCSAPVVERSEWLRMVGDVARTLNRADGANHAYLGVLALHDEIAAEVSAGLASVIRLRRDLDLLRHTPHDAVAGLQTVRSGRDTLEARVAN